MIQEYILKHNFLHITCAAFKITKQLKVLPHTKTVYHMFAVRIQVVQWRILTLKQTCPCEKVRILLEKFDIFLWCHSSCIVKYLYNRKFVYIILITLIINMDNYNQESSEQKLIFGFMYKFNQLVNFEWSTKISMYRINFKAILYVYE